MPSRARVHGAHLGILIDHGNGLCVHRSPCVRSSMSMWLSPSSSSSSSHVPTGATEERPRSIPCVKYSTVSKYSDCSQSESRKPSKAQNVKSSSFAREQVLFKPVLTLNHYCIALHCIGDPTVSTASQSHPLYTSALRLQSQIRPWVLPSPRDLQCPHAACSSAPPCGSAHAPSTPAPEVQYRRCRSGDGLASTMCGSSRRSIRPRRCWIGIVGSWRRRREREFSYIHTFLCRMRLRL